MKNLINSRIHLFFSGLLVLLSVNGLTQNVVIENTNIPELIQMEQKFRDQFEINKKMAVEAATQNSWIIRQEFPDGKIIEIQNLDSNGRPMYYETHKTENLDAAITISTVKVWPGGSAGLDLSGSEMIIGEWDGGAVRSTHQELIGRVTQVDGATSLSGHSTHVAGTLIASGVNSQAKGMAFDANLDAYDFNNDSAEMSAAAIDELLVSNHSYGWIRGWYYNGFNNWWYWFGDISINETEDYGFGFYDSSAQDWDQIAYEAPFYLIVKSAGNDRNDYPGPGAPHRVWDASRGRWVRSTTTRDPDGGSDGYDCIGQQGVSKNILTVGAVDDIDGGYSQPSDVVMTTFSSWGPADDGRIKPDIVGNGVNLTSSYSSADDAYVTNYSGTSMSSPNVAGSLLLLQQHFQNLHGGNPMRAATLKALVIHTADDAGETGPDYQFGWGLMNTSSAADVITNDGTSTSIMEVSLIDGGSYNFQVPVTGGTTPLVVTICWTDPPGTPIGPALNNRTKMLVNDLDLRITDGTNNYYPWTLDPDNPSNAANNNADNNTDNVEQIYIDSPSPGTTYTVEVTHKGSLADGMQNFSVIVSGINVLIVPISEAVSMGLINLYCYSWDGSQYIPISANAETSITPWTGFWVAVLQDVDLLIPKDSGQGSGPSSASMNLLPDTWHLISPPLDPGEGSRDVKDNLADQDNLIDGEYDTNWRVYKRQYTTEAYHHYGDGDFEELFPGRGFFIMHKYATDKTISISGTGMVPPVYHELKLPHENSGYSFHMVGNPYWYNIKWKDCKVRLPITPGLPLGKVAVSTGGEVDRWDIGLQLESLDGSARDTYNRAGVVIIPRINPEYYWAFDIEPMDPYVRLWLQDPSEPERTPLAYDYRAPGLDVYTWEVMLTTTYPQIDARLSLTELANVPDVYNITLLDTDTGETYDMNSDNSFEVSLLSESAKTFVLTATRIQKSGEAKGDSDGDEKEYDDTQDIDEEEQPTAFGIINIRPNPFNPSTTLNYGLERAGDVKIRIYNLSGQIVDTLTNTYMSAGQHSIVWNAVGHASGIYIALVESNGLKDSQKITLMK